MTADEYTAFLNIVPLRKALFALSAKSVGWADGAIPQTMKTYPYGKDPAHPISFEIDHVLIFNQTIARLLKTVDGVTEVRRRKLLASWGDIRLTFKYFGRDYVVEEPFGDNSRYLFMPKFIEGDTTEARDISPIQNVFDCHATWPTTFFWIAFFLGCLRCNTEPLHERGYGLLLRRGTDPWIGGKVSCGCCSLRGSCLIRPFNPA